MTRYRSKPSEVDAVRWTGDNWSEVSAFLSAKAWDYGDYRVRHDPDSHSLLVATPDGQVRCATGSWLIGNENGYDTYEDSVFTATYEAVDGPNSSDKPRGPLEPNSSSRTSPLVL